MSMNVLQRRDMYWVLPVYQSTSLWSNSWLHSKREAAMVAYDVFDIYYEFTTKTNQLTYHCHASSY